MQLKNGDWKYSNVIERILKPMDTILQPGTRTTIWVKSQLYTNNEASGIEQLSPLPECAEDLFFCTALSTTQNNMHILQISTFLENPYTLKKQTHGANSSELTSEQTKHMRHVNPLSVRHLLNNNYDDAIFYIRGLLKTSKAVEIHETYWFPTPQIPIKKKNTRPNRHIFFMN